MSALKVMSAHQLLLEYLSRLWLWDLCIFLVGLTRPPPKLLDNDILYTSGSGYCGHLDAERVALEERGVKPSSWQSSLQHRD